MPHHRDGISLGGMGSDIFGEMRTAQVTQSDYVNDFLLNKSLKEWITYTKKTHGFY